MSENEIDRLKKELEQVRLENEINRLKKELEQVRREKEEAKAREEPEQRKFQDTTLEEYLHNCHVHLYRNLIFADTSRSSTGFTRVDGNYYPKWLRPWHNFKEIHRRRHFEVIKAACKERRLFPPEIVTTNIGSSMIRRGRGDEIDISRFEEFVVEDPVWKILRPIWDIKDLRQEYRCSNVRFGNSRRDITAVSNQEPSAPQDYLKQGLEQRRRTGPSKRMASKQKVKPSLIKPDGWGVREYPDGGESHAFFFDYKTAHDISPASVYSTVAKERLFMEVMQRICSDKTGSNSAAQEHEGTEEVIAMALTQVFDCMVRYGVAYGYVAAGASLILLHVDRADLQTLYCHACVPEEDVGSLSGGLTNDKVMYTAAAQLASFCLLSLQSDALQGALLVKALQTADDILQTWGEPYADAVCVPEVENTEGAEMSSSAPARQYCTQACLLGLKRYKELDDNCPNVCLHRAAKGGNRHPIDADTFTRLMCEQLRQNPYYKCNALDGWGKWGAVGMLFKLELEPYGYTLVSKGALSAST